MITIFVDSVEYEKLMKGEKVDIVVAAKGGKRIDAKLAIEKEEEE